jgi:hypothetical protein
MAYLTTTEYEKLGLREVSIDDFKGLELRASIALNTLTRNYYVYTNLANDTSTKASQFKLAMALQIDWLTRTEEQRDVKSVSQSVGATSISKTYADKTASVPYEVYQALSLTGLLNRGVGYDFN